MQRDISRLIITSFVEILDLALNIYHPAFAVADSIGQSDHPNRDLRISQSVQFRKKLSDGPNIFVLLCLSKIADIVTKVGIARSGDV